MIKTFEINNQIGDRVILMDLGARLVSWQTLVAGEVRDIVLHYPNVQDYYNDENYLGAVIGPYANLINDAKCTVNGQNFKLNANASMHHFNGGRNALDSCMWQVKEHSERAITFKYWLEDGFNGYPGAMTIEVEYRLAEKNSQLKVNFNVLSDKPTIVGPSNSTYFNLAGNDTNINSHSLEVQNNELSDLDFSSSVKIADTTIDNSFNIDSDDELHACLVSPCGKLSMQVKSDYPSLRIDTGDKLNSDLTSRSGICLAPQYSPDSPNQSGFDLTTPENSFNKKILYKLDKLV